MRRRLVSLLAAVVLVLVTAPRANAAPTSSPTAPTPTSTESSPSTPDPSPGVGGIGPDGRPVGGTAMLNRGLVVPPGAAGLPANVSAQAWILVDLTSGDVLAARDPHGRYQPASILKLLTTLVLLPQLPGDKQVTARYDDVDVEGSAVGLVEGGVYTVDQLFTALLLQSGNDAASALSFAAGGDQATVAKMNDTVQALGGYDTHVDTVSGLDTWTQLTSAYDMALILRAVLQQPRFLALDAQQMAALPEEQVGEKHWNGFAVPNQESDFLEGVPGALSAKNGFTDAARHTYAAAAQRNGRRLGVIMLRNEKVPLLQWQQADALLDWGFALPSGTSAVGTLDEPVRAGTHTASAGTSSSPSATRSGEPAPAAAANGPSHSSQTNRLQLIGVIALAAVIALLATTLTIRKRRRKSARAQ